MNSVEEGKEVEESSTIMDIDEIELVLRRFASSKNDQPLTKLLNSMFTETAEEKVAHETSPSDKEEDKKEGE